MIVSARRVMETLRSVLDEYVSSRAVLPKRRVGLPGDAHADTSSG
jgi:hypothetical protein